MSNTDTIRNTIPVLTKYEKAEILAQRALEIDAGKPITIKNPGTSNPMKIALMEFEKGTIPKTLIRTRPDGTQESWSIRELQKLC